MSVASRDNVIAQRILESSVRLFAQKGYAAASTREIVEAARVTKPMLYYYFDSKEGVARAALAHFIDPFHDRLRALAESQLDARARLVEVVRAHFAFCREFPEFARFFYAVYFGPDEQSADLDMEKYARRGHELVSQTAARAVADGLVRAGAQEPFTLAVHGMITIRVMAALKTGAELSRELAGAVVDELLTGFAAAGPVSPRRGGKR